MKNTLTTALLLLSCWFVAPAQASWFSDLFGTSDSSDAKPESQQASDQAAEPAQSLVDNPLVSMAMSQLSLDQGQAEGGLGSLLHMAKSSLGQGDFSTLAKDIPGADMLLAAAPMLAGNDDVSNLLSQAGDLGASLQGGAMVYNAFEKLGISKDMVMPMITLLKDYLMKNGSEASTKLLTEGLGALL